METPNYKAVLEDQVKILDEKFSSLFNDYIPESLYSPCAYAITSGGKRLRPFLVLMSSVAAGGKLEDAYNAAMGVELLHNFTLVHDDIMDNADKRRGRDTVHVKYDVNTAILSGDNLVAFAYKCLIKDCKHNLDKVISKFTEGLIEVCEGQSYDTEFETMETVSIDAYLIMIKKKTAAMLEMCTAIGGYLANANQDTIDNLSSYGLNLGLAFQIQDDLLDIMGDETKFGKAVGGDLVEGKKTYMFLQALAKAEGDDKIALEKVIKNKGIDRSEVGVYKEIYTRLGIIDDAHKEITAYTEKSLQSLDKLPDSEAKNTLEWLANSLIKRNK